MAKMIRAIISKLNKQVFSRLGASRCDVQVPINVSIQFDKKTGNLLDKIEALSIGGETKDMSESGICFYVDSIRLREHYLVGENRVLNVKLDLPNGTVRMQVVGQRYEQIDLHLSCAKYLIGATIVKMDDLNREVYKEFLRLGNKGFANKLSGFQAETGR
jgi:hypothetical protein